jgi:hypothetical protein
VTAPVEPEPALIPPPAVTEPTAPTTLQPDLLTPEGKIGEERSTIDQENRRKTEEFINGLEDGEYQVFDSNGEKNGIAKVRTNKSGKKVVEYVTDDRRGFFGDAKSLVPELNFARFTDATGKEGFDRGSIQKLTPATPAVAPVEPVVEPEAAEPPPVAEVTPETVVRRGEAGVDTNLTVEDKAYRGMTEEEFNNTVLGAGGVESRGDYRFGTEGTNFAEKFEDAESYINFGRDDPRKTGKPTFIEEVDKQPLKINRRGDYEAFEPVSPTKVWKITSKDGELVATEMQLPQAAPAVTPPAEVAPEVIPTPETIEPLRRVARANSLN